MPGAPNMMITDALRGNAAPDMFGALSGAIVAATAANADVLNFVNKVSRAVAIPNLTMAALSGTNFGTGEGLGVKLFKASGMTNAADGTSVLVQRRKTSNHDAVPATELEGKIAATAGLTAGARTLEAQPFHVFAFGGGVSFAGSSVWEPQDGLPLVLEQGEGIVAQLIRTLPGTGTLFLGFGFPLFRL